MRQWGLLRCREAENSEARAVCGDWRPWPVSARGGKVGRERARRAGSGHSQACQASMGGPSL